MNSEPLLNRRMDRRTALKWLLAATAAIPLLEQVAFGQTPTIAKAKVTAPIPMSSNPTGPANSGRSPSRNPAQDRCRAL